MGTWGTGISSNDTYADVYGNFFDLYDDGKEVPEITEIIVANNEELLGSAEGGNNLWFAIAKAQWECKQLQPNIYEKVRAIVESGADLDVWRGLDATETDIRKRDKALKAFLNKLSTERASARVRKKKRIRQPVFEKGDCLTFKFEDGNYGGAVVLEAKAMVGFGLNLVATTRIRQLHTPVTDDFAAAEILVLNHSSWKDQPAMTWQYSLRFKQDAGVFTVIGKIAITAEFDPHDYSANFLYGGDWKGGIDAAKLQFESERLKPKPRKSIKVGRFMKPRLWKLW